MIIHHACKNATGSPFSEAPRLESGPVPENIPEELKERPQWVDWRYEVRENGPTKVLYQPIELGRDAAGNPRVSQLRAASSTDLMTWGTFEEAYAAYEAGGYDGVGFVFCSADPYTAVDLDKVIDPNTGELLKPEARQIMEALGGYQEVSPSGTGVHVIIRAKLTKGFKNRVGKWLEVYTQDRFLTITGRVI